ncbi:MAG: arginase family protein [Candidatus Njordarchaeales archaeon]
MEITFFGIPKVSPDDVVKGTIAIIGANIVTKSVHKEYGVGRAARVLREVSQEYTGHIPALDIDIHEKDVVDVGDFGREDLGRVVNKILENGGVVLVIGGDHATTYYSLRDTNLEHIVWLDAHLDIYPENKVSHASALRYLLVGDNKKRATIIGFRGYSTPKIELEQVKELGIDIISYPFLEEELIRRLESAEAISLDIDFFDAFVFKATRVPEILGINPKDFILVLRKLKNVRARYFDLVEYCPEIDVGYVHGKLLVQMILEVIAVFLRSGYG